MELQPGEQITVFIELRIPTLRQMRDNFHEIGYETLRDSLVKAAFMFGLELQKTGFKIEGTGIKREQ